MAKGSDLDRVAAIVMREMRGPIFILLAVYSVGITGIVLIAGPDGEHMGFFHGFYFMTYTATTTGFGELPGEFSEAQRMWAIACLYMSVLAWVYSIGAIVRLVQNPFFTRALAQRRFAKRVNRLSEPFIIVCGFGDTGSLLTRGLSDRGITGVVIDANEDRIKALTLRNYDVPMLGLQADAGVPSNLLDAGLTKANCRAVVALSGEALNLKIAVMTRLLNPTAAVICRTTSPVHEDELKALGSVVVTDPFESFARELSLALHAPPLYTLDEWLVGSRQASLARPLECPMGRWILCGYGRMGQCLHQALAERGADVVVIDPHLGEEVRQLPNMIHGAATRANLAAAGISHAVGVVAGTDNDTDNLSVLINARSMNAKLFLVVRQNRHENEVAFNAADADLIMQPSLVTARRILLMLISPMIQTFLDSMEDAPEQLLEDVYPALQAVFRHEIPHLWVVRLTAETTPEVMHWLSRDNSDHTVAAVGDLMRDPNNRDNTIRAVPLLLKRGGDANVMPAGDTLLAPGDELLMCGVRQSRHLLDATLSNTYTLRYLITGIDPPRSALGHWFGKRHPVTDQT